jgi:hypothetical protein
MQPGDVLLFTDWTMLRLFPPLRATWSRVGEQAVVPITGANAKRVLFGAINVCTGHRVVLIGKKAGGADTRAFFTELRRRYRQAGRILISAKWSGLSGDFGGRLWGLRPKEIRPRLS